MGCPGGKCGSGRSGIARPGRPNSYLCICQYGHSRSVALARLLHGLKQNAVAIGWQTSGRAIFPLVHWADYICVLQESFTRFVPVNFHHKLVVLDVGPDVWSNPYSLDLQNTLTELVRQHREKLGLQELVI